MKATYYNHSMSDTDVANIARQSFADVAANFSESQNNNLIRFLARGMTSQEKKDILYKMQAGCVSEQEAKDLFFQISKTPVHFAPFGHPTISFRIQAPIFVARQMFKHKIGFIESEESRRYIKTEPEFFFPKYFRPVAPSVKQGSDDEPHYNNDFWMGTYTIACEKAKATYISAIEDGVCPEQARIFLPQGTEVNWVLTGSLYAWSNLYIQRSDSHAQKEIQDLAAEIDPIINELFPVSWDALTKSNNI